MAIPDDHKWRYIFHFTDIHNLDSIVKNGLLCPNIKKERGIEHTNIANMTIQERRAKMDVTAGPGGKVHDYVPFYFSSINPMLLTLLNQKNVDQPFIIYFCVKIQRLLQDDAVFTDASANTNDAPNFYSNPNELDKLDWFLIDKRTWSKGTDEEKHKKMAEAFIYHTVELKDIDCIVVWNKSIKKEVEKVFRNNNLEPPTIVLDGYEKLQKYRFYYTKFFIPGQTDNTLVKGPLELLCEYQKLLKRIKEKREKQVNYTFQTIGELVTAIDNDFTVLPELKELVDLQQNYPPHDDTVEDHTKKVVAGIMKQTIYNQASVQTKALLKLAAYLHDIGKGPKSKWNDGIMNRAYPDHPADSVPMLERILTEEITNISEEEIRQLCMLVIYHDIVGDCIKHGRDKKQIVKIIKDENDLEMLSAMAIADSKAISSLWAMEIASNKDHFCKEVLYLMNEQK